MYYNLEWREYYWTSLTTLNLPFLFEKQICELLQTSQNCIEQKQYTKFVEKAKVRTGCVCVPVCESHLDNSFSTS